MTTLVISAVWWACVIGSWTVANRKGRRGWAYGLVSAFVPIVGVVAALVVKDRALA